VTGLKKQVPSREKVVRKADARERRYEEDSLMLNKDQEEYQVSDEVFDRPTLEAVYRLIHRKVIDRIKGAIKAGKEAHIYWGTDPKGKELAIKIYYTSSADFRKGMVKYIEGDPRFGRVRHDIKSIIYTWTQKEFSNLQLAEQAGVNAPRPIEFYRNVLVMTFIGTDGVPAPVLREKRPEDPEAFYRLLLGEMRLMYARAGLVHGDLSEYNVMVWEEKPVIFDISQAMLKAHPMAWELLRRDIENVNAYFGRIGVRIYENDRVEEWVTGGAEDLR
jgi:RIO kinase 1